MPIVDNLHFAVNTGEKYEVSKAELAKTKRKLIQALEKGCGQPAKRKVKIESNKPHDPVDNLAKTWMDTS